MAKDITPFLMEKWAQAFYFFDNNKDGEITAGDYIAIADHISDRTGANQEQRIKTRQEWLKWRYIVCLPDPTEKLDLEHYVSRGAELFKDVENQKQLNRTTANNLFDRLDLNEDGKISLEELNIFYEAIGIRDLTKVETIFKHLDKDGDGFIQREELVDDFVRHFTDPDPVTGKTYLMAVKIP